MKTKIWLKYVVYMILIGAMVYLRGYFALKDKQYFQHNFLYNLNYMLTIIILSILIGVLLGGEHWYGQIKKEGTWKVNLPKIIFMGIPSLLFAIGSLVMYTQNQFIISMVYPIIRPLMNSLGFDVLFQVILGYVVITSFYKCPSKAATIQEDKNV